MDHLDSDKKSKEKERRDEERRWQIEQMECEAKGTILRRDVPAAAEPPAPEPSESGDEFAEVIEETPAAPAKKDVAHAQAKKKPTSPTKEKRSFPFSFGGARADSFEGGMAGIFSTPSTFKVDQTVNLNDHTKGEYEKHRKVEKRTSFVDIFFGGNGSTRSNGSVTAPHKTSSITDHHIHRNSHQKPSVTTTWKRSVEGRLLVLVLILIAISLVAVVVPLVSDLPEEEEEINDQIVEVGSDRFETLKSFVRRNRVTLPDDINNENTNSYHALRWISDTDPAQLATDDTRVLERFAMAAFCYSAHPESAAAHSRGELPDIPSDWIDHENWMSGNDVCDWFGINCTESSEGGRLGVTHVDLANNNIRGRIPNEFVALSHLRVLDLAHNEFYGTIPRVIARLYTLRHLILKDNQFTGTVPDLVGQMESAREIDLSHNGLEGKLPQSLDKLLHLHTLLLDHNTLTGTIPPLKDLAQIETLRLDNNFLIGKLPVTLFYLKTLEHLDLSYNELTGTIPPEVNSMRSLTTLYMANNLLKGQIPVPFGRMHHLLELDLRENEFEGTLPAGMGTLTLLERLLIGSNSLTGTLPPEWGGMTGLQELALEENQLNGTLPVDIGNLEGLEMFRLHKNKLTGEVPDELCSLISNFSLRNFSTDCLEEDPIRCECCTMCY